MVEFVYLAVFLSVVHFSGGEEGGGLGLGLRVEFVYPAVFFVSLSRRSEGHKSTRSSS